MADSYAAYRLQLAPPWFLTGGGPGWMTGNGQGEDTTATQALQTVEVRSPDYAPMDATGGTSQALGYIQNDRALLPVFGDDSNLDATRLYLKSGFSQGAAGLTRAWLPGLTVDTTVLIGAAGLVWQCTVPGVTGTISPFDMTVSYKVDSAAPGEKSAGNDIAAATLVSTSLGQVVPTGQIVVEPTGVAWTAIGLLSNNGGTVSPSYQVVGPNPTQQYVPCPNAPGWYYAGTDTGLIDALVSAGFYNVVDGQIVKPRIYNNRDFYTLDITPFEGPLEGWGASGALPAEIDISLGCDTAGTAGQNDEGEIAFSPEETPLWTSGWTVEAGQFCHSAHEDIYFATTGGTTGANSPFPPSSPSPSQWPPAPGGCFYDNGVVWLRAAFSPIPTAIPIGSSWGLTFTGSFTADNIGQIYWSPNPPDGNTEAWSRIWLVIPGGNFVGAPRYWGFLGPMAHVSGSGTLACTVVSEGWGVPVALSSGAGGYGSGTVSGSVFTLASGTPWTSGEWINCNFLDVNLNIWKIVANTSSTLTVTGSPHSGTNAYSGIYAQDPLAFTLVTSGASAATLTITDTLTGSVVATDTLSSFVGFYRDSKTGITISFSGTTAGGDSYTLPWAWGEPPFGYTLPAIWGQLTSANAYGMIYALCQRWLGAHELLMGVWLVEGSQTTLDSVPTTTPWNPSTDVTINGITPPYFQYND